MGPASRLLPICSRAMSTSSPYPARAVLLRTPGPPSALVAEDVSLPPPGPGQLLLRQTAAGVNFHDCYIRSGLYKTLPLPGVPGIEAVGVVEAVGPGAHAFRPGDKVGWVSGKYGGYASARLLDASLAFPVPPGIPDAWLAGSLVRGLTVELLARKVHQVNEGDAVLVHAAAGGVGRMLCRRLASIGARVVGTAGSKEKAEIAREAGCEEVILYREEDFVAKVREFTGGRGVRVAYDSVGKDTLLGSLDCLATRGHLVVFGQSSGPPAPLEVARLAKGSLTLSRPILFDYIADPEERGELVGDFFQALNEGAQELVEPTVFKLEEAAKAHEMLEARASTGPIVLVP
ncbi:quinone oxidoreductase [Hyaloraphidium curvatum]|nr:quinone oxidoreductase [Hyaloraphidium curvatum]